MRAACPPSWNHRGRGTGDAIYYDCLAPYISTTGHPGQKWNGVYGLALSRGALPLRPPCRYFSMRWRDRSFDARLCAVKENEASEWGKVRSGGLMAKRQFTSWIKYLCRINLIDIIQILDEIKTEHRIREVINLRILSFLGHIARRTDALEKIIVQGKRDEKRYKGRSSQRWLDVTRKVLRESFETVLWIAQNK